jgi:hypothetical protein
VAITNIDIPKNADVGEALIAAVIFRQVKVVKLKTVDIDVSIRIGKPTTKLKRQSSPPADVGRKQATTSPQAVV